MTKKYKITGIGKKVIPVTAALGILFSMAPVAENKASAGIGAVLDITITVLGAVANTYEALGISPGDRDPGTHIDVYAENETYQAPSFTSGEFNISMYHTQGDSNFLKSVKVRYPNGRIEIHQLRLYMQKTKLTRLLVLHLGNLIFPCIIHKVIRIFLNRLKYAIQMEELKFIN
ncbi:Choline binding protein A [Bacillus mycoides]|nr:Choline binding protein A [Bacillus mycoides]